MTMSPHDYVTRSEFEDFKNFTIEGFEKVFNHIDRVEYNLTKRIDDFETRVDKKFDAIDAKFVAIDKRFDAIDKKFDAIDKKFEAINKQFNLISKHFGVLDDQIKLIVKAVTKEPS